MVTSPPVNDNSSQVSGGGNEREREEIKDETTDEITEKYDPLTPPTRTSSRIKDPTQAFFNSVAQENLDYHNFHRDNYIPQTGAFESTYLESPPVYYEALHQENFSLQNQLRDLVAFLTHIDGNTMHFGIAMKVHDMDNFKIAIQKELMGHCERKH